jgi:hypothetical protein
MNEDKDQNIKIEITQAKLLDVLMHSATREDIAELRSELKSDKVEVKSEILEVKNELKGEISGVRSELRSLGEKVDSNFRWIMGVLVVTILVPIALHFIK